MTRVGRPPLCECGDCERCCRALRQRERWAAMTPEERRAKIAKRDREKARQRDRERYYRHREQRMARNKAWAQANPAAIAEHKARWIAANPEKRKAQIAFGNAVRRGEIVREACEVCGDPNAHGHHDDYSKPLEVRWLCPQHHADEHVAKAA